MKRPRSLAVRLLLTLPLVAWLVVVQIIAVVAMPFEALYDWAWWRCPICGKRDGEFDLRVQRSDGAILHWDCLKERT